jgi:hypothetical protein
LDQNIVSALRQQACGVGFGGNFALAWCHRHEYSMW